MKHIGLFALAFLCSNNLLEANATIQQGLRHDFPPNNHNIYTLHGVISIRQADFSQAKVVLEEAIIAANKIISQSPKLYDAYYAKGIALSGLVLLGDMSNFQKAVESFLVSA